MKVIDMTGKETRVLSSYDDLRDKSTSVACKYTCICMCVYLYVCVSVCVCVCVLSQSTSVACKYTCICM